MRSTAFFVLLVLPRVLAACNCVISQSVCQEVVSSDLLFVGTVESVQSAFMPELKQNSGNSWVTDPEITKLKSRYLKVLSALPRSEKLRLNLLPRRRSFSRL